MIGSRSGPTVTEPRFLIDSNIAIYVLDDARSLATTRLEQCKIGSAVTSAIVYAEVMRGFKHHEHAKIDSANQLFDIISVLPFDVAAAKEYIRLPFKRRSFDRLIAAHALSLDLTLVTNNEADFADIPGLKTENWTL